MYYLVYGVKNNLASIKNTINEPYGINGLYLDMEVYKFMEVYLRRAQN